MYEYVLQPKKPQINAIQTNKQTNQPKLWNKYIPAHFHLKKRIDKNWNVSGKLWTCYNICYFSVKNILFNK